MNQEPRFPLLHPQGQMHPLANNSMDASRVLPPPPDPLANNSMGTRQVDFMGVNQVLPPPPGPMFPTSNQQTPFPDPLASMSHRSLLPNQTLQFFPGPSDHPVHGFRHVMAGLDTSQVMDHDPSMQLDQEDLQYFLAGRVRPVPGIQIYRCGACGDEFANRHAFGGHMSSHSKKNSSNAKASGSKSSKKNASSSRRKGSK